MKSSRGRIPFLTVLIVYLMQASDFTALEEEVKMETEAAVSVFVWVFYCFLCMCELIRGLKFLRTACVH